MAVWGRKHMPASEELAIRAQLLDEGGPPLWADFMKELRERHLGIPLKVPRGYVPVFQRLQAAYEEVVARQKAMQRN